jgi:hypothetical protein
MIFQNFEPVQMRVKFHGERLKASKEKVNEIYHNRTKSKYYTMLNSEILLDFMKCH